MHPLFEQLTEIFWAGVNRVDPYDLITSTISLEKSVLKIETEDFDQSFDLEDFEGIVVIGAGKAVARMALAMEHILGSKITSSFIVVKYGHTEPLEYIDCIEAGHPIPDKNGVQGSRKILDLAEKATKKTLVFTLISGGGSALMPYPCRHRVENRDINFTLKEKQSVTRHLLECGATINEINCIRKHLSGIKGGNLAKAIYPATSVNLILSDVVGDSLDVIASGSTVPDPTNYGDAMSIIDKYSLVDKVPEKMIELMRLGIDGALPETPKPGDPIFNKSINVLIGTNFLSLKAASAKADRLGYTSIILSSQITGEAREVAKVLYGIGKDAKKRNLLGTGNLCIIAGGETTVTIKGNGKGGRNQELALSFLAEMESYPADAGGIYFLSASTDGNDGPTDAAGAFASKELLKLADTAGCKINAYLKDNNAYVFFDEIGHLLKTGPTNTNVCDLQVMLIIR